MPLSVIGLTHVVQLILALNLVSFGKRAAKKLFLWSSEGQDTTCCSNGGFLWRWGKKSKQDAFVIKYEWMFAILFGSAAHLKTICLQMEQISFKCCMAKEFVLPPLWVCAYCQNFPCLSDSSRIWYVHRWQKRKYPPWQITFIILLHEGTVTFSTKPQRL